MVPTFVPACGSIDGASSSPRSSPTPTESDFSTSAPERTLIPCCCALINSALAPSNSAKAAACWARCCASTPSRNFASSLSSLAYPLDAFSISNFSSSSRILFASSWSKTDRCMPVSLSCKTAMSGCTLCCSDCSAYWWVYSMPSEDCCTPVSSNSMLNARSQLIFCSCTTGCTAC